MLIGFYSLTNKAANANYEFKNNEQIESINKNYLNQNVSDFYIIGPGDSLEIIVSFEYPELDQIITVDGNGYIFIKKLNRVYVQGLTINELNKALNEAYSEFVKFPSLSTRIINYRPIKVYLDGEVENPGMHILNGYTKLINNSMNSQINDVFSEDRRVNLQLNNQNNINSVRKKQIFDSYYFPTIFDAIREAGGFTYLSDFSKIEVIRVNPISRGAGFVKTDLNFEQVFNGDSSQNIRIYDGDKIIIGKSKNVDSSKIAKAIRSNINPKFINVFVNGRVNSPGEKTLPKISTLNDALMLSGGPKVIKGPVSLISFSNTGLIEKKIIRYSKNAQNGSLRNPFLKNKDIIFVGENILSITSEVISEVTEPFQGLLSVYGLINALD